MHAKNQFCIRSFSRDFHVKVISMIRELCLLHRNFCEEKSILRV